MMIMSPCKDCDMRFPACHDRCTAYKEYKKENDGFRAQMHKDYDKCWTVSSEKKAADWSQRRTGRKK